MIENSEILHYLAEQHAVDTSGIAPDTQLFSSGLVDSFAMIDLVTFIEEKSGARMDASDITLDNLDTVDRIISYMTKKAG